MLTPEKEKILYQHISNWSAGCSLATFQGLSAIETVEDAKFVPVIASEKSEYTTFIIAFVSLAEGWSEKNIEGNVAYPGNGQEKVDLLKEAGWSELFRYPCSHDPNKEMVAMGIAVREKGLPLR